MTFNKLKKEYIQCLLASKTILIKSVDEVPFTLRSGRKSYMFFDHSKLAISPKSYKIFIDAIQYLLDQTYDKNEFILCNVDSKISAQMVGSVAYNMTKPQIIYKSQALLTVEKGSQRQMTGDSNWSMPVAILDDVATGSDGTAKNVGDLVMQTFPTIKDIQIFVGFIREIKQPTYNMHYLVTQKELLDILWTSLQPGQQKAIEKEWDKNSIFSVDNKNSFA
jgi:orotate phosphoribosyltransferase